MIEIGFDKELKRKADRISNLILYSDLSIADISIEINKIREEISNYAPEYSDLFEMIYVSRFNRLWEQWREEKE